MTTAATTTRSGWKNRIFLPVILILALSTGAASNAWAQMNNFQDVPSWAPYYGTVNLMFNRQITHGCVADPLQYCPDATLLRWQMAVFIIRAIYSGVNSDGDPERFSYSTNPYFTDVAYYDYANPANTPYGHPAFKYIQKMKEFGITSGCTVDHFCPEYATTNFAAAIFSVRGRQIRDQGGYGPVHVPTCSEYNCYSPYFYDIPTTDGAFPYIQRAREIVGSSIANAYCSSGYFCQNNELKRGDMSTYVVYGIWGQPAQQPEQYYEAPGGGAALPNYVGSAASCGDVIFWTDRGLVQISPTEMYAYAKSWTAGGNAFQYTNHVTNARVYRDSSIIIPSKNATDTTGSSQAYARLPDDPGSFDPGIGVLTELATHSWSSSACGSSWIRPPSDLFDQIDVSYLSSISPAYGIAGSSAYVTIAGHNLYFAGPLNVTGGGVTVSNLTHPTVNSLQVMLTFDSAAAGEKKLSFTRTDRPFTTKDISLPVYDATPIIYSMSPSNFTAGVLNVPVTISGSGFGTNPTVSVSGYGVSARLDPSTPPTDTQIVALFDVAGDADSAVDVSVLANGTSTHNFAPAPNAATQRGSNTKLATVNPNNNGIISISYRAFIRANWVQSPVTCTPWSPVDLPVGGPPLYVSGDNRDFQLSPQLTPGLPPGPPYRVSIMTTMKPASPLPQQLVVPDQGQSREYDSQSLIPQPSNPPFDPAMTGQILDPAILDTPRVCSGIKGLYKSQKGTPTLDSTDQSTNANGSVTLHISGRGSDPVIPFSSFGAIKWDFFITIAPDGSTASVTGSHTCFPAHEIVVGGKYLWRYGPSGTYAVDPNSPTWPNSADNNRDILTACLTGRQAMISVSNTISLQ